MASEVYRLIEDLNLSDQSNVTTGAFVVEKDNALKERLDESKEHGELSKCGKPAMTEESSTKQQPSSVVDDGNIKGKGGDVTEEDIADDDSDYESDDYVPKRSDPTLEERAKILMQEYNHWRWIESHNPDDVSFDFLFSFSYFYKA